MLSHFFKYMRSIWQQGKYKYTDLQEMDAETGLAQLQAISMKCIIKESQVVKSQLLCHEVVYRNTI
ncbi:hypothetical protein Plhal304r1_c117g0176641 [Plasmopara halstedii]